MADVTSIEQARSKHTDGNDQGVAGLGYAPIEQIITATIVKVPAGAIDADRDAVGYKDYTHGEFAYVIVNRKKSLHYLAVPVGTEVELLATPMECAAAVVRGDPGRIRSRFRARDSDSTDSDSAETDSAGEGQAGSGAEATETHEYGEE